MLKIERFAIIEHELEKKGTLSIPQLSQMLSCSEETIRRDLKELESAGKLTRTRGGAHIADKHDKSYSSTLRKVLFQEEKISMATRAMHLIQDSDVLFLDSSTTCLTLAEMILNSSLSVTIVTNSLLICNLCNDQRNSNINLVCLGGNFRWRSTSFVGYPATDTLAAYHADRAFVSCPKATLAEGLSDNHLGEARVREGMLRNATQRVLLMDHTKFDASANILFKGLDDVNIIITDEPLSPEWAAFCERKQIRVYND